MFFFYDQSSFIALIGDIRNSRELHSRKVVQDKLKSVLEGLNKKYASDITSRFTITLGDEFQGLLSNGKNVLSIIGDIRREMQPVEFRFGLGIGKITTDINTELALGADGPGYYKAREAITKLKENEKKKKTALSDIRVEMDGGDNAQILLINTIFELMKAIERNWTEVQKQSVWDMLKYQEGQKNLADRLGITQPSVNKALLKGNYYTYENAIRTVETVLGELKL